MAKPQPDPTPADDLLTGAQPIADFLFGDANPLKRRRRLYHVASQMKGTARPPIWKLGATLCARKSALLAWISERERASAA
ncbi:MAG TPA: hypothetical protein VMU87_16280 [Stellaceae bacterium]|nr:hypothetical protein [Stellaceae bacterium]